MHKNEYSLHRQNKEEEIQARLDMILKSEIKGYIRKLSKLTCERNEAHAKLDIFREELRTLQGYIENIEEAKFMDSRITKIQDIVEKNDINANDFAWLMHNISSIEGDLIRLQHNERLYKQIMIQKTLEMIELKEKQLMGSKEAINYRKCKISSSPRSNTSTMQFSLNTSAATSLSPRRQAFGFIVTDGLLTDRLEKHRKMITQDEEYKLIDELSAFKLKFALFQESTMKRDNEIKGILKTLKNIFDDTENQINDKRVFEHFFALIAEKINTEHDL